MDEATKIGRLDGCLGIGDPFPTCSGSGSATLSSWSFQVHLVLN